MESTDSASFDGSKRRKFGLNAKRDPGANKLVTESGRIARASSADGDGGGQSAKSSRDNSESSEIAARYSFNSNPHKGWKMTALL